MNSSCMLVARATSSHNSYIHNGLLYVALKTVTNYLGNTYELHTSKHLLHLGSAESMSA